MVPSYKEDLVAETVVSRKLEVLKHLQCIICLGDVNEARLCPSCSKLFCDACIKSWLRKSTSCPVCRATVQYDTLVKGYSINQIQQSIRLLFSSMDTKDVICDEHKNQSFSLFCYSCEVNICVGCLFSKEHAQHKEQIVLTDKAFEHYKQKLSPNLTRISKRKEVVDEILMELNDEKEQIEKLCKQSEELLAGEVNPGAVMQIVEIDRKMANLRSNHHNETSPMQMYERSEFMSEPTILVFSMNDFSSRIYNRGSCCTYIQDPYGFEWQCELLDGGEEDALSLYLCLITGKPSEYCVLFGNEPKKVFRFELGCALKIGVYKPIVNVDNDTQEITLQICQSKADKIQHLQDVIARLKKLLHVVLNASDDSFGHEKRKQVIHKETDTQDLTENNRHFDADRIQQLQEYVARLEKDNAEHVARSALPHKLGQEKRKRPFFRLTGIVALGLCHLHALQPGCTTWSGWCWIDSCVEWLYDLSDSWCNNQKVLNLVLNKTQ